MRRLSRGRCFVAVLSLAYTFPRAWGGRKFHFDPTPKKKKETKDKQAVIEAAALASAPSSHEGALQQVYAW